MEKRGGGKHSGKGSPTSQEFHPSLWHDIQDEHRISRMLEQGFSGPWSIRVSTVFFIVRSPGLRGMITDHLMILPKNPVNLETLSGTTTTAPSLCIQTRWCKLAYGYHDELIAASIRHPGPGPTCSSSVVNQRDSSELVSLPASFRLAVPPE
jgi:hypothetical protein